MDAETDETLFANLLFAREASRMSGSFRLPAGRASALSGTTQALSRSLRREVSLKLHSELSGGQRRNSNKFLLLVENSHEAETDETLFANLLFAREASRMSESFRLPAGRALALSGRTQYSPLRWVRKRYF